MWRINDKIQNITKISHSVIWFGARGSAFLKYIVYMHIPHTHPHAHIIYVYTHTTHTRMCMYKSTPHMRSEIALKYLLLLNYTIYILYNER